MNTRRGFAFTIAILLALLAALAPPVAAAPTSSTPDTRVPTEHPANDDVRIAVPNQAPTFNGHFYCENPSTSGAVISIGFDDPDDAQVELTIDMTVYINNHADPQLDDFYNVNSTHFGSTFNFFGLDQQPLPYGDIYGLAIQATDPHGAKSEMIFVNYDPTKQFLICEISAVVPASRL